MQIPFFFCKQKFSLLWVGIGIFHYIFKKTFPVLRYGNLFGDFMQLKLPLCTVALCAMFGLNACSSDSSSSPDPVDPTSSGSVIIPTSSAGGSSGNVPVAKTSRLPATANALYTDALYPTWKGFHYTTQEEEATKYPTLGAQFGEIFGAYNAQGLAAARVIWSTYNYAGCQIDEAQGTNMYKRGCTVSEGIGYGMLITLFQGDMDAYNRLWVYSKAYRNTSYASGHALMPWLTSSFSWDIGDDASATDADLDIAASLVIAYYQTGNAAYLEDALTLINALWTYEVNPTNLLLYSGDTAMWAGADPAYNLSYFSPVALRLFAAVDPTHDWKGVLDAEYAFMQQVQAAGTGVFPDWCNGAGVAVDPNNNSAQASYWRFDKESVRIPWRLAWDYYWFQDERAATILNTLNTFIATRSNNDPAQIPAVKYSWNLAVGSDKEMSKVPMEWWGAWCLTGMAGADAWVDACTNIFNAKQMTLSTTSYFSDILQMMMSQLLNGKYVKPATLGF